jgi:Retrotransposon gag protein
MRGRAPEVFTGDRSQSDQFLEDFAVYRMANQGTSTMKVPMERVALALTYIHGKNVAEWRRRFLKEVWRITTGNNPIQAEDEYLWRLFEREFKSAFTDTTKKQTAHQKFLECRMKGDDLDNYLAEFEHWRSEAEWGENEVGTITQFRRGLRDGLHKAILEKTVPRPVSLREWVNAARDQHELWAEIKASVGSYRAKDPTANAQRWRQALGRPQVADTRKKSQVTPMDVDAVEIAALDAEERKRLSAEGRRFYCKKQGHITKDCAKRKEDQKNTSPNKPEGTRGRQGMSARAADVEEKDAAEEIEAMVSKIGQLGEKERDAMVDRLVLKGF